MSEHSESAPSSSPRLLSGLLGIPAANRERLSHLIIRGGTPVSVQGHFHRDVVAPFAGQMAAEPGVSEQISELRASGLLGTGVDVTRRDGVFHVKLWNGAHERGAWERRMATVDAQPQALRVLAAAGEAKAQQLRAQWAQQALQRAVQGAAASLPAEVVQELVQVQPPTASSASPAPEPLQLVRMPTGHSKTCPICKTPAFHTFGDVPLHPVCLPLYLEGATGNRDSAPSVPANPAPAEEAVEVAEPTEPEKEKEPSAELATVADQVDPTPQGPAATRAPSVPEARVMIVLDADQVGLPDGSQQAHPFVIDSLDKVATLVSYYELGQRVTRAFTEPGQVWLTDAMLKALGLPTGEDRTPEEFRAATVSAPALVAAVQAGWDIAGGAGEGPSLGRWTKMSKGAQHARIAIIPLMTDFDAQPVLEGDPSPGTLARRLALFAGAYSHPFKVSPQSTGQDFLQSLRWKERTSIAEPQPDVIHAKAELDGNWTRVPSDEERLMVYLHGYDRGGSYLAGLSSNGHYGVGQPVHIDGPVTLEPTTYGLVKIANLPEVGDWRAPHPLLADVGAVPQEAFWRHTTTVRWAQELGYEPEILEAWIWPRVSPIFRTWYPHLRDGRALLQQMAAEGDPDAQLALAQLKAIYTRTIGGMGSKKSRGQAWYAPDRRWGILAQARVNIERMMHRVGKETGDQRSGMGVWPVAWDNDTFVYASNDPNPETAWPGSPKDLGSGVGKVRWEGSTMLADHLEYLTGKEWTGKDQLTKDWNMEGEQQ